MTSFTLVDGEVPTTGAGEAGALTHHRIRFYPKVWSTFDGIEPCKKPKFCIGCTYKHPRCDASGRVPAEKK